MTATGGSQTMPDSLPLRCTRRRRASAAVAAIALCAAVAVFAPTRGDVFFTGLDDSAQCALVRGLAHGLPLRFADSSFAAVPAAARSVVTYRPAAARKTRDLAHQIDARTFSARPFFQPFLPLVRAFLPGLPLLPALAVFFLVGRAAHGALGGRLGSRVGRTCRLAGAAVVAAGLFTLTPWPARFCLSPYSEGAGTLFAALALALSSHAPERGRFAAAGAAEGVCLGLSVCFHPILSVFALPIGAFAVMRAGSVRHAAALAFGAAAGFAPLVWSTKRVTAPYGDFFSVSTLRAMIDASPDIRALAIALGVAAPVAAALLASALSGRVRSFFARPPVRLAASAACAVWAVAAVAAACLLSSTAKAITHDADAMLLALPAVVALCAAAFSRPRPASWFAIASLITAAIPCLVVQGNEVHVGIWSLRRSLPFATLVPLAAFFAAAEGEGSRERLGPPGGARSVCTAFAVLVVCATVQIWRMPMAYGGGGEVGAARLAAQVEDRLRPGALYLFARIGEAAPFAAAPGRDVFGLNDRASNALGHGPVAAWLRDEARRRPVYAVALCDVAAPIVDDGIVLVPDGDAVAGEVSRVDGKCFSRLSTARTERVFRFLRVLPTDSPEGAAALRGGAALRPSEPLPFGMAPGGWDVPRHGKAGRWASDGAAFWGPVPEPGETLDIDFAASWWTRDGAGAPAQTLRLELPFPGESTEAVLVPRPEVQGGRWSVTRAAAVASDGKLPSTALYRIRASERYDERGFPPALAACVSEFQFTPPRRP